MKHFFLITLFAVFLVGTAYGERQKYEIKPQVQRPADAPPIALESFEMCNNWARHYCRNGNHERMVNHILKGMKERGMTITTTIIKSVARRTLKNTAPPPAPAAE